MQCFKPTTLIHSLIKIPKRSLINEPNCFMTIQSSDYDNKFIYLQLHQFESENEAFQIKSYDPIQIKLSKKTKLNKMEIYNILLGLAKFGEKSNQLDIGIFFYHTDVQIAITFQNFPQSFIDKKFSIHFIRNFRFNGIRDDMNISFHFINPYEVILNDNFQVYHWNKDELPKKVYDFCHQFHKDDDNEIPDLFFISSEIDSHQPPKWIKFYFNYFFKRNYTSVIILGLYDFIPIAHYQVNSKSIKINPLSYQNYEFGVRNRRAVHFPIHHSFENDKDYQFQQMDIIFKTESEDEKKKE